MVVWNIRSFPFHCEETSFGSYVQWEIDGSYQLLVIDPCFLPAQKAPLSLIQCFLSVEKIVNKKVQFTICRDEPETKLDSFIITRITYTRCDQHAQYYTACGKIRDLKNHAQRETQNKQCDQYLTEKILPLEHLHTQNDHAMLYRNACTSKTEQIKQLLLN